MAIYGQSLTIQYIAWDTANNTGKTGDAANHTLRWVRDGVAAAPTNSPSEVDATNAPGVYKLTLTATETSCWVGTLCGKSSTTGVVIMPITLTFERLPTAAPGASGGLPVIGSVPLAYLDASVSSRLAASAYEAPDNASIAAIKAQTDQLSFVGSDVKATLDGETVVVSTNQDKTGYSLTTGYDAAKTAAQETTALAIKAKTDSLTFTGSDVHATLDGEPVTVGGYTTGQSPQEALTAQGYTSARAGNLDNLDATVSSRLAASSYVAPDNAGIAAIKAKTDNLAFTDTDVHATLDGEKVTVQSNEDKTGYSLTSEYDRAKNALSYTEYTAPDNTSIAAIKAQTDKLTFNASNAVSAYGEFTAEVDEDAIAAAVVARLGTGRVEVVSPVDPDSLALSLVRGDDYTAALGRALSWTSDAWPDLAGATIRFSLQRIGASEADLTVAGSVVQAGTGEQTVQVELTHDDTASLQPGVNAYLYDVEARISEAVVTLARGYGSVLADVTVSQS